jgi:integrase
MPRKPKQDKQSTTVLVNNTPVRVLLHPPTARRKSWYAYWSGLDYSVSTCQARLEDALLAVDFMVKNHGKQPELRHAVLSDDEFVAIQRRHFERKSDEDDKRRAAKSLKNCLEAIKAFKSVTALPNIAGATADDCANFQTKALVLPKNWRQAHRREDTEGNTEAISPNTVVKWLRELQAAFERCNRNAPRKKCVRGVVDERKLLSSNPWHQFTWVEGIDKPPRQFTPDELLSLLTFFETTWRDVPAGALAIKLLLWSWSRRLEIAGLRWDSYRQVQGEHHFETVGKRKVKKWFRVPDGVYRDMLKVRTDSPFVFAGYTEQLRQAHAENPNWLQHVREFTPATFGQWLYKKVKGWGNPAYLHIFRKTSMQYARRGEDIRRDVAAALRVSESVMMKHYVTETDEELRGYSNATYHRIAAGLPKDVARRYGYVIEQTLESQLQNAIASKQWELAGQLTAKLAKENRSEAG